MKNIYLLPTDKPSRLFDDGIELYLGELKDRKGHPVTSYNIYITSDEEIKEGDWVIFNELEIVKCTYSKNGEFLFSEPLTSSSNHHFSYFKKIILTTYQDLINDGVQAIDDEFLEWFCKNPSCEEVEVIKYEDDNSPMLVKDKTYYYKIIIPKEEPFIKHECRVLSTEEVMEGRSSAYEFINFDKQETFKEAYNRIFEYKLDRVLKAGFIAGAKWQQERSYSEQDVHNIISNYEAFIGSGMKIPYIEWFEQFKKE